MAAVVAFAAPLLLLACAAIFQSPAGITEDRGASGPPAKPPSSPADHRTHGSSTSSPTSAGVSQPLNTAASELLLAEVLRRCDAHPAAFLRHRGLVASFISEAVAHLVTLSPLLADVSGHHDGSAFEGTRIADSADFDTYALLSGDALLRHFELRRGAEGRIAARLRPGDDRGALPTELAHMLTSDGYLDARRFKKWAFGCLETALRRAALAHPQLRPVVYSTHGAAGVNLTAADGTLLQVDLTATLVPPPTEGVLRSEALRPCGLTLVPPGRPARWFVYSSVDLTLPLPTNATTVTTATTANDVSTATTVTNATTANDVSTATNATTAKDADDVGAAADQHWFIVDTVRLERDLLSAQPLLRSVIRLLKWVSNARRWEERFHINSYTLKHAVYWAFAEGCAQDTWGPGAGLLSPTVASLRTFDRALRRGRMDNFFVGEPADVLRSVAGDRPALQRLADEVRAATDTLIAGDQEMIRSLLNL